VWQECFAQLVGTILSLWDASELDRVGGDAEVLPTFINLTDAAIHMVRSQSITCTKKKFTDIPQMPSMVLNDGKKLDNILSISTAASNKYLFHFNSFNSLTQWTAGIRLAVYEHTTLQEAYTGALIAGKGKQLNNIRIILDRQRAMHEDWARVRFGAGTPWRRCWCVVSPPDEKEYAKMQKTQKKSNIYNRSPMVLKGDIKFYDKKKITKKTRPIATVKDAYSCYAIYPQSKPLIDQSTLVKIEGKITIHSNPETTTEGFVFVMPETHPAVSGFEIMLRFLFPVFDTFALYGRPTKLISDVLDTRGLMFAMPPDRRYGYLEMWDVVGLIHSDGSQNWSERQWRKQLKELTSTRMLAAPTRGSSRAGSRRNTVSRTSMPASRSGTLRFEERGSVRSQPSTRQPSPTRPDEFEAKGPRRVDSAPPTSSFATPRHQRSVSEQNGYKRYQAETPSRLAHGTSVGVDAPPTPPEHHELHSTPRQNTYDESDRETPSPDGRDLPAVQSAPTEPPLDPVASPPSFGHAPSQKPPVQPYHPPPMMKPNAQMDPATLHQLADATHTPLPVGVAAASVAAAGAAAAWKGQDSLQGRRSGDYERDQMSLSASGRGFPADQYQHSANGSRSGHSGSRLPTIPASPYIEPPEFVETPTSFQPAGPPVPEHAELQHSQPQYDHSAELAYRQRPGSGGSQLQRKPVPGRSSLSSSRGAYDAPSTTSSSLGSSRNDVVDPEILASLNSTDSSLMRNFSLSSSRYDDDSVSTTTPDYASTISEEAQPRKLPARREDRPRSGMLKTIGDPSLATKEDVVIGDAHYKLDAKPTQVSSDFQMVDFGPTYSLNPDSPDAKRPGTSGTMTQLLQDNNGFSKSKENLSTTPGEQKRQSWLGSGTTTPIAAVHMRNSSTSSQLGENRTMAWQPGMAPHSHSSEAQQVDADEWVAQRAATANQPRMSPGAVHGRNKSHTPPPFNRNHSGDWTHTMIPEGQSEQPQRPPSRPLSRPLSRGANTLIEQLPTSLSAREQEHVARITGTPLLDLKHNPGKHTQKPSTDGLTAYIDHREKEKAKAKSNRTGTAAMQAEIDRRMMAAQQRQMMEMQQMGQQQQQMGMAQGGYGTPSMMVPPQQAFAYSNPVQMQQMYQQQPGYFPQQAMSPSVQQGWSTPSPQSMQGPYFAPQQQPRPQSQQGYTQPYGASFDQAQAAARYAHQQQQQQQQQYRR
jgi:CCR4-NOT transcriptional complex subunit CAF120